MPHSGLAIGSNGATDRDPGPVDVPTPEVRGAFDPFDVASAAAGQPLDLFDRHRVHSEEVRKKKHSFSSFRKVLPALRVTYPPLGQI